MLPSGALMALKAQQGTVAGLGILHSGRSDRLVRDRVGSYRKTEKLDGSPSLVPSLLPNAPITTCSSPGQWHSRGDRVRNDVVTSSFCLVNLGTSLDGIGNLPLMVFAGMPTSTTQIVLQNFPGDEQMNPQLRHVADPSLRQARVHVSRIAGSYRGHRNLDWIIAAYRWSIQSRKRFDVPYVYK